jgi:DNA-binding LacI/PurR family transcriptional regulator
VRAQEFVKHLQRKRVTAPVVHADGDQLETGIRATTEILATRPGIDAIMCFNDIMAFGALKALRQQHHEVPRDVRVIGVDGLAAGTYVTPQLTTLALNLADVAAVAVDMALGLLDGGIEAGSRAARRKVRPKLVIRESS